MTDEVELDLLQQEAHSLGKHIRDLDREIAREVRTFTAGFKDGEKAISRIQDRHEVKLKLMFDLGGVSARIEDLENRMRKQGDLDRANALAADFAEGRPVAQEDYLDWLQPAVGAPEYEPSIEPERYHRQNAGEDRMLQEMLREEVEPEESPDGWRSR
ncbi:hypothetical protein [Rhizobium leguminosarum]|uniref:hypothetical protein n=1 Tax=Rhizobium leguminosarum TaxID=384 RepID=UPI001C8FF54C|nr:hypothetical protein [Rhizobium leguminosarum]MBY2985662.1 hypothetical protein [Rhizobium leguminosarum]